MGLIYLEYGDRRDGPRPLSAAAGGATRQRLSTGGGGRPRPHRLLLLPAWSAGEGADISARIVGDRRTDRRPPRGAVQPRTGRSGLRRPGPDSGSARLAAAGARRQSRDRRPARGGVRAQSHRPAAARLGSLGGSARAVATGPPPQRRCERSRRRVAEPLQPRDRRARSPAPGCGAVLHPAIAHDLRGAAAPTSPAWIYAPPSLPKSAIGTTCSSTC